MYCRNCGMLLPDNVDVCPGCNNAVQNDNVITPPPSNNMYAGIGSMATPYSQNNSNRNNNSYIPLPLYIALGVVTVIFIIISVFFFIGSSHTAPEQNILMLTCEPFPEKTDAGNIIIQGTASAADNYATLYINGEVIDSFDSKNKNKNWSKNISLNNGINNFVLTLTDNQNSSKSIPITIEKTVPLTYATGTVMVKLNKSEIYIRPTPQISDKYVLLLAANDYTSQFVCAGEEHIDSEGYLWCKVLTPANGIGWVRADLVRVL